MSSLPAEIASRLCAECGLCCDGTLFHSVTLQSSEDSAKLSSLGLRIKQKKGRSFFYQPCSAHQNCSCSIYSDRPSRCRLFDCQQLQRLARGETTEEIAQTKIREARTLVSQVHQIRDRLEETNPNRCLATRTASVLAAETTSPQHVELKETMEKLELFLKQEFRIPA